MSRSLKDDYNSLLEFIDGYSLKNTYNEKGLSEIIKPLHKGYYSALALLAELHHQDVKPYSSCEKKYVDKQREIFWLHLSESFSELGSAFFLILNGCYKASDQVMRSSIENFIKAQGSLDNVGLTTMKNVYEIFEISKISSFFSTEIGRNIFQELSRLYSDLCSSVHSGTEQDMQGISALGDFPAIDLDRAKIANKNYLKIIKFYVSSLSVMFSEGFHGMHHINKDIVQLSLSATALKELHR
ncbi:MAG: hypothetical protein JKX92_04160 [Porticoccaceae bacterium]|nr:hypothetical protein [Porticoccaceae bacterium]